MRRLLSEDLKLLASFEMIRTRMKRDLTLMNDITSSTTTIKRTYVVLTHDVRLSSVNRLNQNATIEKIVRQNNTLHKNIDILRVAWTKKVINQRKEFFSLIIKIVSSEMTNRLIKEGLLNEHTHLVSPGLKLSMRRKNDEEAQIKHHMKKQIDSARRNAARHKREAECEKANK